MKVTTAEGYMIQSMGLYMTCPGCSETIHLTEAETDAFLEPRGTAHCPHCDGTFTACPNDDCYGLGPDCTTCGGQSGGLVRVIQEATA